MMMTWFTVFTVCFTVLTSFIIADDPCKFQDTKGLIDLTSLGRNDKIAAYPDRTTIGSNYKYSYNPCKPFTEGTTCIDVAVCQVSQDGQYTFILGKHDSAKWNPGGLGGTPSVAYEFGEKKVTVSLECGAEGVNQLEALGEQPINTYKFRLTHICACWDGCKAGPPETSTKPSGGGGKSRVGGGTVFIIILLVVFFVYFVGFAAFYRFHMQLSGTELIAHRTFWVALPGYAKDGVVHIYQRVSGKGATPYQSV